ncbi:MAG: hypothetical protein QXH93_03085, partial [Conexivisphaerales archaeon]
PWKIQIKEGLTRSGTYVIPRACSMIRGEDRGKVVSYLRKRGAIVVLWIPSRKEKKLLELQVT